MPYVEVVKELDPDLRKSLASRPFKSFQYRLQELDKNKLEEFHWNTLVRQAKQRELYAVREAEGEPIQMVYGLRANTFHTRVFKIPCFNLNPCLVLSRPRETLACEQLSRVLVRPYLVEGKVDVEDSLGLDVLQTMGFRVVGCTVKLSARKAAIDTSQLQNYIRPQSGAWVVRAAEPADLPRLQELIAGSHVHSHFFAGAFPGRELGRILFREWMAECLASSNYTIWVLEDKVGVSGFVSFLRTWVLKEIAGGPIGVIDFIAVDPTRQGGGMGRHLLARALAELLKDCNLLELRTALENYGAQRLYEKFGFRLVGADYMVHNHRE